MLLFSFVLCEASFDTKKKQLTHADSLNHTTSIVFSSHRHTGISFSLGQPKHREAQAGFHFFSSHATAFSPHSLPLSRCESGVPRGKGTAGHPVLPCPPLSPSADAGMAREEGRMPCGWPAVGVSQEPSAFFLHLKSVQFKHRAWPRGAAGPPLTGPQM